MVTEPAKAVTSIVLVGDLNPSIFTPYWLLYYGMVEKAEADAITTSVVHPDVTELKSSWFDIQVQRERFQILQRGPSEVQIFDFTCRLFRDLLPHTPLRKAGINRQLHFRVPSWESLDELGNRLAPKAPWGDWGKRLEQRSPPPDPERPHVRIGGLRSITMEQSFRDNKLPGYIRATIEPSSDVLPGVYFSFNEHYELSSKTNYVGADEIISIIADEFTATGARARMIAEQMLSTLK